MESPMDSLILAAHLSVSCTALSPRVRNGGMMGAVSVEQFLAHPDKLLSQAQGGELAVVTQDGKPVFMAVPLGAQHDSSGVRLELAVSLFDREQVSLGVAAHIAGLSISEMIDDLGRRRIPVVRYSQEEFADEMKYVRGLARAARVWG